MEENNPQNLMTSNNPKDRCPECGGLEVNAMIARTVYECGSSDYDGRPGTFRQSEECKTIEKK